MTLHAASPRMSVNGRLVRLARHTFLTASSLLCVIPNSLHRDFSSHLVNTSKKRHSGPSPTATGLPPTTPVVSASKSVFKRFQAPPSTCPPDRLTQFPQGYLVSFSCPCASNDELQQEVPVRRCLGVFLCKEMAPEIARTLDIRAQSQAELHRIRA